ncbi:MAG: hypothetical protein ACMUJM_25420 [bacterium]
MLGLGISILVRDISTYVEVKSLGLPILYNKIYCISLFKGILFGMGVTLIPPLLLLPRILRLSSQEIIKERIRENTRGKSILLTISRKLPFLSLEFRYTL